MQTMTESEQLDISIEQAPISARAIPRQAAMQALVHRRYGSSEELEIAQLPRPEMADDEVLIRVEAAALCKGDWHVLTGKPYPIRLAGYGLRAPSRPVLGQELAGRVVAVGAQVTQLRPGDEVFGVVVAGAFAEYVCAKPNTLAIKPAEVSFEDAAATTDSAMTALQGLRDHGQLQAGQTVLINGASGGVGTFAVQLARHFGAEVTAVCSGRNVELVRSLGADHVIDYTQTDFAGGAARYDVMFDLVGDRPLADCRRVLTPTGSYVGCAAKGNDWFGPLGRMLSMVLLSLIGRRRMVSYIVEQRREDLTLLGELLVSGALKPVIGRRGGLSDVPAALRHQGEGHARGKTVIALR